MHMPGMPMPGGMPMKMPQGAPPQVMMAPGVMPQQPFIAQQMFMPQMHPQMPLGGGPGMMPFGGGFPMMGGQAGMPGNQMMPFPN